MSVKIRNLSADGEAVGKLIDAASKIDGLVVNGVTFDQSDRTLGVKQARKAAFEAAKAKAEQLARLGDIRLRRVSRIEALGQSNVIPFFSRADAFAGGSFKTLVPVRDVTISESVNVWYETLP